MRIMLASILVLAFAAACGKKQAPKSPANETEATPADDNAEQNIETPDDPDQMQPDSADPCEGGE